MIVNVWDWKNNIKASHFIVLGYLISNIGRRKQNKNRDWCQDYKYFSWPKPLISQHYPDLARIDIFCYWTKYFVDTSDECQDSVDLEREEVMAGWEPIHHYHGEELPQISWIFTDELKLGGYGNVRNVWTFRHCNVEKPDYKVCPQGCQQ